MTTHDDDLLMIANWRNRLPRNWKHDDPAGSGLREACDRIEALVTRVRAIQADRDDARKAEKFWNKTSYELRERAEKAEAERDAQHAEHIARYGQAMKALEDLDEALERCKIYQQELAKTALERDAALRRLSELHDCHDANMIDKNGKRRP